MLLLTVVVIRAAVAAAALAWASGWRAAAAPEYPDVRCGEGACDGEVSVACQALAWRCDADADSDEATLLRLPAVAPCSCCDFCLRQLPANSSCWKGSPLEEIPAAICGPRLFCSEELRCEPMETPCVQAQLRYDEAEAADATGTAETRPRCTDDGDFGPVRCTRDGLCYCVEPEGGSRIFGEVIFTTEEDADNMTCGCSLFLWKAERVLAGLEAKEVEDEGEEDSEEDAPRAVVMARCASDGSFAALQCAEGDALCGCVGAEDGALLGDPVARGRRASLPCYDEDADGESACEAERRRALALVAEGALGVYPARCDPDGSFARWQPAASGGWRCVDPLGAPIDGYAFPPAPATTPTPTTTSSTEPDHTSTPSLTVGASAFRPSSSSSAPVRDPASSSASTSARRSVRPSASGGDCRCARARWRLRVAGVADALLPTCCADGAFRRWQCRGDRCFCVDADGAQTDADVPWALAHQLPCFHDACPAA